MNIRVPPSLDSACMRVAQAEQMIADAIDNPHYSNWLRTALVAMQQREPADALADVATLYRLLSERAASTHALVVAMDGVRP
jgi:hypothetical protein